MKLKKAVEINEDTYRAVGKYFFSAQRDAFKLGIEALKAWKCGRDYSSIQQFPLLPGED